MIVGERTESYCDKLKRHKNELSEDISCFEQELEYAKMKQDEEHERYCNFWINTLKNALKKLEEI